MRLFGLGNQQNEGQPSNGNTAIVDPPEGTNEPEDEITLPEDANLDELYAEDGSALFSYVNDEGEEVPCDQDGNPIPEVRPGFEPAPPAEPARVTPREWKSPFEQGPLSDDEAQELVGLLGERPIQSLQKYIDWQMNQSVVAASQHDAIARELGVSPEVYSNLAAEVAQTRSRLPGNLRGTKDGEILALLNAIGLRATTTGEDLTALLQQVVGQTQAPPKKAAPTTPTGRTPTPRPGPDVTTRRTGGPADVATRSLRGNGMPGDPLKVIQSERRSR